MKKTWVILCGASLFFGAYCQHESLGTEVKQLEEYVKSAASFLSREKMNRAIVSLKNDIRWKRTHTELFLIDQRDTIWFFGNEHYLTWTPLPQLKTVDGEPLITAMRDRSPGWVSFLWNQDLVYAYVTTVKKGKASFTLGALLFVENIPLTVQEQVFRARNFFDSNGLSQTEEQINNPSGQFVYGSISVEMYDHQGICLADSFDNNNVGNETALLKDDTGRFIFRDYVNATEEKPSYKWVEHTVNGLKRRTFVLRLRSSDIKKFYILSSTYYPEVNDAFVVNKVKDAIAYLEKHGPKKAFIDFSLPKGPFYKARLAVVVYDEHGVIKAQSKFPSLVGINAYDRRDQGGYPITKNILELLTKKGEGWLFHYIANAAELVYGQKVIIPEGTYFVTVQGYTPVSPKVLSSGIAERISRTLVSSPSTTVFHQINFGGSLWSRGYTGVQESPSYGDLFIEIYDIGGFCVSAGFDHVKLWQRIDSDYFAAIKQLTKENKMGDWTSDTKNGVQRHYYVRICHKSPLEKYYIFVGYKEY